MWKGFYIVMKLQKREYKKAVKKLLNKEQLYFLLTLKSSRSRIDKRVYIALLRYYKKKGVKLPLCMKEEIK